MAILNVLRAGHWPSLVGAWLHFEVSFMAWLLIGALGVPIGEEFHLNATQKGLLVACPLLGGALLRIAVGVVSDRFGAKRTGLYLLGGVILAVLWGWLSASTYLEALGMGLLLGFAGASFAVALPVASRAYPPAHQGLALGVAASANSGTVLAMLFAPRLSQTVGWHGVFGMMIVPLAVTSLLFGLLVRSDREASRTERHPYWWHDFSEMLHRPSVYWLCGLYAVTFGGFAGLCSLLPIFLHDQYGVEMVLGGSITALCALLGSAIRPFGGFIADRMGGLAVLGPVFAAIAGLLAGLAALPPFGWAAPLLLATVGTMGFGNGVVFQVVSERFPKQIGTASGVIGAAGGIGGFLLPLWLGGLKDLWGSFGPGLWLCAAVSVAAALSVALTIRRGQHTGQ
ncbi:MAG TPA: MFS transporter [Nitrospira sp.]|nr:MFS transporter [Nitrospira sp.]